MKRLLLSIFACGLALSAATAAMGQTKFYCVKPDGAPIAAITMPYGSNQDPSVVCNAVVHQCYLTCAAVQQLGTAGPGAMEPDVPTVTVTQQMLQSLGSHAPETPAFCASQYQNCVAKCRGNRACIEYCRSVRSGCGTGNRGQ